MKALTPIACVFALAAPLSAEELRPAPAYYVETFFALTMAEALATSCSEIGMDLLAAGAATTELQSRLEADGFDPEEPFSQMIDPAPALRDLQAAFLEKHPDLTAPDEAQVCAVARAELAEDDSTIGRYLNAGFE